MAFERLNFAASNNSTQRGSRAVKTGVADGPPRVHNYRTSDPFTGTGGIFTTAPTAALAQTTAYFNKRLPSVDDDQFSNVVEDWLGIFPICPQGDIIEIVITTSTDAPETGANNNTVAYYRLLCQGYRPVGGIDQPIFSLVS